MPNDRNTERIQQEYHSSDEFKKIMESFGARSLESKEWFGALKKDVEKDKLSGG